MVPGLEMATRLVMELCGGTPSENVVAGSAFGEDRVIDFPLAEVKRLAGIDVPFPEVKRILGHLGFMVAGSGAVVKIAVADLAFGRSRQGRYRRGDRAHCRRRQGAMTPFERGDAPRKPILSPIQLRTRRAKRALATRGMVEAVTWSLSQSPMPNCSVAAKSELALANPIASDCRTMRPSLLPGLVAAVQAQCQQRLSGCCVV